MKDRNIGMLEKLKWFIDDAFALICFILFVPLVPMFALFDEVRSIHENEMGEC